MGLFDTRSSDETLIGTTGRARLELGALSWGETSEVEGSELHVSYGDLERAKLGGEDFCEG